MTGTQPISVARRAWLWLEMAVLFFGIPTAAMLFVDPKNRSDRIMHAVGLGRLADSPSPQRILMPMLIIFTLCVLVFLLLDRTFPKRQLWNWAGARRELPRILKVFLLGAYGLFTIAYALDAYTDVMSVTVADGIVASAFLQLPASENWWILIFIAIGYPWLSCYPQEITHRAFFFHRYGPILPGRWPMIAVNALAFCWLHAPFWSGIALAMTLPAGVLFAWTYDRTKSTLAVTLEHAIYGWWVFFVGLGWFVFTGSIGT